jgi:hypothetical protein
MKNQLWIAALALSACASAPRAETAQPTRAPEVAPVVHETKVAASRSSTAHPMVSHSWLHFRDARGQWLDRLGEPLLECAQAKPKTKSPECKQREASFEVAYGLTALHRLTRLPSYAEAAERAIDRKAIEKSNLEPYAAAWFLATAREREIGMDKDDLRELAEKVADQLEAHLVGLDDHKLTQGILFGAENNVAWAIMNLWRWAEHVEDVDRASRLADFTKTHFLQEDMDEWCPLPVDSQPETFEFFPPCLNRAMTVLTVMPDQIANPWLAEFATNQSQLAPLRDTPWTTHAALNFSRSLGLWTMYKTTNEAEYRRLYIDHIQTQMKALERQDGSADPWIVAFGIYAVGLSYGS